MRTKVGYGLVFVGGFLLVLAILAQVYATDRVLKTPLNVDSTNRLDGTATLGGPEGEESFPVKVTSLTRVDSDKSDDKVVVWKNSSCVVRDEGDVPDCVSSDDPDNRLLTASTDDFATDRVSAIAVNDPKYLPSAAEPHEGIINKWPFNAEKKDYPYWSGTLGETVTAAYDRTEKIQDLETYVYKIEIENEPVEVAAGVDGLYNDTIEISVEPFTGAIVDQHSEQSRTTVDGDLVLALDIAFTEDQVKTNVEDAKSNTLKLGLLTDVIPLVGYIVGIPLLLIGLALLILQRRQQPTA
ncbi:MAG: hypothetical protein JWM84_571 [Nocardioides sp.]|nr:hypothetical protein [Nocardioides sp.]